MCDSVSPYPHLNIFDVQIPHPYDCVIAYSAGAVHSIVKDFRENHTDTTVLFTVTVVPGNDSFYNSHPLPSSIRVCAYLISYEHF